MTKKEFFDLIQRYNKGKCSKEEENLLLEYCEKVQIDDISTSWNLSKEENIRVRVLQNIHLGIREERNRKTRTRKFRKISRRAAIFIGLITSGYFYLQYVSQPETLVISENAITLELEDGTIQIIEENDTTVVFNKNGNLVSQQNGNQLVYNKTNTIKELVYNTLTVPYGKRFELLLSDGTKAHLNAGSSLRYPVQFLEGMNRKIFISGEAYLDVAKDKNHPFIVNASDLNIRVLGTQFNVHAYPEDNVSEVVLLEGSVGLYSNNEIFDIENTTKLTPGHKAIYIKSDSDIKIKPAITSVYTAWRNGELVFRNMTFENILKKLERHYDVTIINKNKNLSNKEFNVSFRPLPLEKVLEGMKAIYGLSYTIEGKKITIQ